MPVQKSKTTKLRESLGIDVSDLQLTLHDLKFITEYAANGFRQYDAYKKAGLVVKGDTPEEIRMKANALLVRTDIKKAIIRIQAPIVNVAKDTFEYMTLEVLKNQIDYDIADYFNDDWTPKKLSEIPREKRHAITGIKRDIKDKTEIIQYDMVSKHQAMKVMREIVKMEKDTDNSTIPLAAKQRVADILKAGKIGYSDGMKQALKDAKIHSISSEYDEIDDDDDDEYKKQTIAADIEREQSVLTEPIVQQAIKIATRKKYGETTKDS